MRTHPSRYAVVALLLLASLTACSKKPTLKALKAAKTSVEYTITTISTGTVDALQQAVLGFSSTGRVSKILVKNGDKVARGKILAMLENSDLESVYINAEAEAKRAKELFSSGLISKVALDDANKAADVAKANLDRTIIRAPFDGSVTEMNLEVGELAGSAQDTKAPIRLIDNKPRIIKGDVDEVDLAKIKVGTPARIRILAARTEPYAAVVSRVVPYVSTTKEQNRTSQIELKTTESDHGIPVGASADIEIVLDKKSGVIAVPTRVVLGTATSRYVFVYADGRIHKTKIIPGIGNYERTEILTGVEEGTIVVYPAEDVDLTDGLKVKIELTSWP